LIGNGLCTSSSSAHLLIVIPALLISGQWRQVEVKVPDGDARRRPRPGGRRDGRRRGGHGDRHGHAVPAVATLVPAERLARGEASPTDGAPVRPTTGASRRSRTRRRRRRLVEVVAPGRRRRRRRLRMGSGVLLRRGRLAVAGLVAAERLVGREGLPADGAPEPELLQLRS